MGNQNQKEKEKIVKKLREPRTFLLCPKCHLKVPYLDIFIDSETPKIKMECSCKKSNSNNLKIFQIYELKDYIEELNKFKNNKDKQVKCANHSSENGCLFCMNCEKWLCENCFMSHNEKNNDNNSRSPCEKSFNDENCNYPYCKYHNKEVQNFFCKKCNTIFCKICFMKHNIKNKVQHKGYNLQKYLNQEKISNKHKKLSNYKNIIASNTEIKNKILKKIQISEEDNPEFILYKNLIEESFNDNKKINEQIMNFIEIILDNCSYFYNSIIKNKKFICNIIKNTHFNLSKIDETEELIPQINNIIYYYGMNYINTKISYIMSKQEEITVPANVKGTNSIELLCYLNNSQFATVNQNCTVQIWSSVTNENLLTLTEHSSNITSIISLKNGLHFATASDDNSIKIWDFTDGKCLKTIITHGNPFLLYDVYGKENQIGCLPFRNSISIYDYTDEPKNILNISLENSINWIEGIYQFPNDGRVILSTLDFFEIFSPQILEINKIYIKGETPKLFLQIKNGDLAVGLLGYEIYIYDNNLIFKTRLIGHSSTITSLIEVDENKLFSSSLDSNIIVWNTDNYEMDWIFINNNCSIKCMILLNQNKIITSSKSHDHFLETWTFDLYSKDDEDENN